MRNVLQLHGATLTKTGGIFRVAARSNGAGRGTGGENIRVVPLRFIGADQARSALQPLATTGTEIVASTEGRYLVLSGSAADLEALVQLLETLDVDQMLGLSVALVPLKDASAKAVATEVGQMFGSGNDGAFRALPIERMNAVLMMARSARFAGPCQSWIARLDQTGGDSRQMRVFPIQNRRAADLAKILNGMLVGQGANPPDESRPCRKRAGSAQAAAKIDPALSARPPELKQAPRAMRFCRVSRFALTAAPIRWSSWHALKPMR